MQKKIGCWEFFQCSNRECPVYISRELRCWLVSGTHCRDEIQGAFSQKMEVCLECEVFQKNMDPDAMDQTCRIVKKQFTEAKKAVEARDREIEAVNIEMAVGLSEVCDALKKISSGDPLVRISETSEIELVAKLKHMVNRTAENLGEMVDLSHEFAINLAELFDVMQRISKGDLNARISGDSKLEIMESLKKLTNQMIDSVSREIRDRKQAEETLGAERKQLLSIFESINQIIYVTDPETHEVLYVSNAMKRAFNKELVGGLCYKEFQGLDAPCDFCTNKIILKEKYRPYQWEYHNPILDRDFMIIDRIIRWPDGRDVRFEIAIDINELKRTERALKESEEKSRAILRTIPDIMFQIKRDGTFLGLEGSTEDLYLEPGVFLGKKTYDVLPSEIAEKTMKYVEQALRGGEVQIYEYDLPIRGQWQTFESRMVVMRDDEVLAIIRNITERRRAEEEKARLEAQLLQAQKMEAIGTLAGGIAHDFNNLLMGIQGRSSLMLLNINSSHPHFEHLKGIEECVQSAADLTRQLLGFAMGGKYQVRPTNLNEIIRKSSEMFGRTKKEIKIHTKYQEEIWTVEVDEGQIEQVLLNLYVNAWQAMPGGGELYLQTENVILDVNYTKPFSVRPGRYVKISVTDTGSGMDKAIQQRIFEPFFTTKEMGRGTGLGLASAYGIIKSHEGIINVQSVKGEGTVFNIYLPSSKKSAEEEKRLPEETLKGTETILLVDDEEMILNVGKQMIESLGYEVIVSRSGREAIKVYEKSRDKIDMVIVDMIMPEMGGGEIYDRLKGINPGIKVLLASGYSLNGQATEIMNRGCGGFIQKPFNLNELSKKIREILAKG
ncbi:MAG: response regulator [Pseudomonadota bacterium]